MALLLAMVVPCICVAASPAYELVLGAERDVCNAYAGRIERVFGGEWSFCRQEALSLPLDGELTPLKWWDIDAHKAAPLAQSLSDLWQRGDADAVHAALKRWHEQCDRPIPAFVSRCAEDRPEVVARGVRRFYTVLTDPATGALQDELRAARVDVDADGRLEEVIRYQRRASACGPSDGRPGARTYLGILTQDGARLDVAKTRAVFGAGTVAADRDAQHVVPSSLFVARSRVYVDLERSEPGRSFRRYGARLVTAYQVHELPIGERSLRCELALVR